MLLRNLILASGRHDVTPHAAVARNGSTNHRRTVGATLDAL